MARWALVVGLVALSAVLAPAPVIRRTPLRAFHCRRSANPDPGISTARSAATARWSLISVTSSSIEDLAVQRDGKTVAVGAAYGPTTGNQFDVVRYAKNGALDPTFGIGGKVSTDFDGAANAGAPRGTARLSRWASPAAAA